MRMYLSGAITHNPKYFEQFNRAALVLQELYPDYVIINPANLGTVIAGATHEEYMIICHDLIHMADTLVQLPGWEASTGANRELGWAEELDMLVVNYESLVKEKQKNG